MWVVFLGVFMLLRYHVPQLTLMEPYPLTPYPDASRCRNAALMAASPRHLGSLICGFLLLAISSAQAQELEPNAYSPAPTGFNILVVADTYNTGDLAFDPAGPITEASAQIHTAAFGYVRTLGIAGRSASLGVGVPYARGDLKGLVFGEPQAVYRSGLGDPRFRVAVNLLGAPAMTPKEFAAHRPTRALGASLVVAPPLGQYDPTKLINIGSNRWSFKPEVGYTRTFRKWTLEGAVGVWLFTENTDYYGGQTKVQDPISSLQVHAIYTFKPRMWISFDANFYRGGETSISGGPRANLQENSRAGVVFALPVTAQHTIKFSYSRGAVTRIGADFSSYGLAWQYLWRD
jgi:Putative MetA-pathway of phenol degradation